MALLEFWMLIFNTSMNTRYSKHHIVLCNIPWIFTSIINPSYCFACCAKIRGDLEANSQCGIHEGMHEHLAIAKCSIQVVAKCPP